MFDAGKVFALVNTHYSCIKAHFKHIYSVGPMLFVALCSIQFKN